MRIDFTGVADKYTLESSDVDLLNGFFNTPEVTKDLIKIEEKRKKLQREIYIVIPLIVIVILALLFFFGSEQSFDTFIWIGVAAIGGYIARTKRRFNAGVSVKNSILPLFVKKIDPAIAYSSGRELFPDTVGEIHATTGLLHSYDRVDLEEDSIKYTLGYRSDNKQEHSIDLFGFEMKTSKKQTGDKGKTRYTVADHCYIIKLIFLEPRFTLKSGIKIKGDTCNSSFGFFARLFAGKKRVEMENIDFEKQFDVFSEDQVEARMLVTPAFMSRLLDFQKKTGKAYEFYFKGGEVYIKSDVSSSYMEFSLFRNVFDNALDYVRFYMEIKNIKGLVKDLGLFYYDKGTFSQVELKKI